MVVVEFVEGWVLVEVVGPVEEGVGCEEDAFVAIARADWEIWAEEMEGVPVDWDEAL